MSHNPLRPDDDPRIKRTLMSEAEFRRWYYGEPLWTAEEIAKMKRPDPAVAPSINRIEAPGHILATEEPE